jgi:hypothetical protein
MAEADTCVTRTLEGVIRGQNFTIEGIDDATVGLVTQFNLQFQRPLTRVYDLASTAFYYVVGNAQGQVDLQKVVGPRGAPRIRCTCDPYTITLDASHTLCHVQGLEGDAQLLDGVGAKYDLLNAMPFGLQGSGSSENPVIVFSVSYMFSDIAEYDTA